METTDPSFSSEEEDISIKAITGEIVFRCILHQSLFHLILMHFSATYTWDQSIRANFVIYLRSNSAQDNHDVRYIREWIGCVRVLSVTAPPDVRVWKWGTMKENND